jgi:RNA polymerase sigma factor (sigma-70 family)
MADITMDLDDFLHNDYDRVVRSVAVVCGNHAVAIEAVQEALVKVLARDPRLHPIASPAAWVTVVATNWTRRRFRRGTVESRALSRVQASQTGVHEPLDPGLLDLSSAIARLPQRQKQAVVLFYLHDLEVARVAEVLGVSTATVKTALARGRASLARTLISSFEEDRHGS